MRVANLLPLLALKGFAIRGREKDKDPYDVVWLLNAWDGGPEAAGTCARRSPVAEHPHAIEGLEIVRSTFAEVTDEGSMRYARFHVGRASEDSETEDRRMRLARDAQGTVRAFFDGWDRA